MVEISQTRWFIYQLIVQLPFIVCSQIKDQCFKSKFRSAITSCEFRHWSKLKSKECSDIVNTSKHKYQVVSLCLSSSCIFGMPNRDLFKDHNTNEYIYNIISAIRKQVFRFYTIVALDFNDPQMRILIILQNISRSRSVLCIYLIFESLGLSLLNA